MVQYRYEELAAHISANPDAWLTAEVKPNVAAHLWEGSHGMAVDIEVVGNEDDWAREYVPRIVATVYEGGTLDIWPVPDIEVYRTVQEDVLWDNNVDRAPVVGAYRRDV